MLAQSSLLTLLPRGEGFSPNRSGAIGLVVRDFVRHSQYQKNHMVFGSENLPAFPGCSFESVRSLKLPLLSHSYRYIKGMRAWIREHSPNIIELHNRAIYVPWVRRLAPSSAISFQLHNDPQTIRGLKSAKERQDFLKVVDAVYCVSDYLKRRFLEGVEDSAQQVHVIPIGLDLDEFDVRQKSRQPVILFVGRVIPEKGALLFAKAIRQVLEQIPSPWRVEIIGAEKFGSSSTPSDYEKQVIAELEPLQDRVNYHGYLPFKEVVEKLTSSEIAVVPSQWQEPFGRTALEAMAAGVALISTPYGGLAEVIGGAAQIVDSDQAESFATEILTLIKNPDFRCSLQIKGKERVAQHFSIQQQVAKLDAYRTQILEKGRL